MSEIDRTEQQRIVDKSMDQTYPATKGFGIDDRIKIINNVGGPMATGNGCTRINNYCMFVAFHWKEFSPETQKQLQEHLRIQCDGEGNAINVELF